jgi:AcrR family transcriptional regulator
MAKGGTPSQVGPRAEPGATKARLVHAAIEALRDDGFAGASARSIARRADCNQGSIFYHFGSVANLLLAALDETSRQRMDRYQDAVASARSVTELAAVAAEIYREDLDAGHIAVLAEMIAGASSTPGLGAEVAARVAPWIDFTEGTVQDVLGATPLGSILPGPDVAYAIVALYLGVEMLSHLDGDRTRAESLLRAAAQLSRLFAIASSPLGTTEGAQ